MASVGRFHTLAFSVRLKIQLRHVTFCQKNVFKDWHSVHIWSWKVSSNSTRRTIWTTNSELFKNKKTSFWCRPANPAYLDRRLRDEVFEGDTNEHLRPRESKYLYHSLYESNDVNTWLPGSTTITPDAVYWALLGHPSLSVVSVSVFSELEDWVVKWTPTKIKRPIQTKSIIIKSISPPMCPCFNGVNFL
jgi:hypothetical protein